MRLLERISWWRSRRLLREARGAREKALEAVRDAERRNDTRDLGRALMAAAQATTDTLRLELGR